MAYQNIVLSNTQSTMHNLLHRKIKTINKDTTVDISNLQPGELIYMDFAFYNVTSIRGFASMLIFFCANTIMIWVFPTASKRAPVRIIRFILTTLMNDQRSCKHIRVDEDSAFRKLNRCHKLTC